MTRRELKHILKRYGVLTEASTSQERSVSYRTTKRNREILLPDWSCHLPNIIDEILCSEHDDVVKMIIRGYLGGKKDYEVIGSAPVTESGYYRIKKAFEERVYEMFILLGYVTKEEILSEKE